MILQGLNCHSADDKLVSYPAMSRVTRWKNEKTKVKVVFRLQFHATHVRFDLNNVNICLAVACYYLDEFY